MQKSEAAAYLAGAKQVEGAEASAPTNLHVISGEVVEKSEDGKVKVDLGGLVFSEDDEQAIEIDTLGGLEVGDTATILLAGQENRGMTPLGIGGVGTVDRVVKKIEGFETDYVKTEVLEANYAHIKDGVIDNAKIDHANVNNLEANYAHIKNGVIDNAKLNGTDIVDATITGSKIKASSITGSNIDGSSFTNGQISGSAIDSSTLTNIPYAEIDALKAKNITAEAIETAKAYVEALVAQNITAQNISADHATISTLDSNYAHIANGVIDNARINYAKVEALSAHYAEIQNGKINSALIDTAAIVDEQVFTVTGNKATLASIDASKINVTNLNADNITVNKINGQPVTGKSISDALSQHETDISTKVDTTTFNTTINGLNDRIDGAIETFTGTVVPTRNNAPASSWNTTKLLDEHVGDVYYVVNSDPDAPNNGWCYRFAKISEGQYEWVLIKDSDVTSALSRLRTAEGQIKTFDSDISTLKTDTGELKTKTQSLETSLGDKVDVTTFNDLSSDVEENSATITTLSNTVSQKADSSTVTTLSNTVNSVKQTADTNKASITNLTQTVNSKADSSTVTTLTNRVSTAEQNLNGITTRVGKTESTLETVSNPNLTPWFSVSVDDTSYWNSLHCRNTSITNAEGLHGIWDREEGWAHITLDARTSAGNNGSKSCYMNMHVAKGQIQKMVKPGGKYTWMAEVRNLTWVGASSSSRLYVLPSVNNATLDVFGWMPSEDAPKGGRFTADGIAYGVVTAKSDFSSLTLDTRGYCYIPTGCYADFDLRISLYEGEYSGPYKPYVDQTLSNRVKSAETSITQNAEAITLRATKAEFDALSIGGTNRLINTANPTNDKAVRGYGCNGAAVSGGSLSYSDGVGTYTVGSTANAERFIRIIPSDSNDNLASMDLPSKGDFVLSGYVKTSTTGNGLCRLHVRGQFGTTSWKNAAFTNLLTGETVPSAGSVNIVVGAKSEWTPFAVKMSWSSLEATRFYISFQMYNSASGNTLDDSLKAGDTFQFKKLKLEKGNKATDWTPAPEDMATSAELKVASDAIDLKVSKNDVINQINVSTEGATIAAKRVNIEGAAIFTSGRLSSTSLNNAYDAKGAAQTVQNNLDNLAIGGRNLLLGTSDAWSDWVTPTPNAINYATYWYISKNDELLDWAAAGQQVTFSMEVEFSGVTASSSGTFRIYSQDCFKSVSGGSKNGSNNVDWLTGAATLAMNPLTPPADGVYTYTKTATFAASYTTRYALLVSTRADYWGSGKYRIRKVKYELGNKPTDWSPAPEDLQSNAVKRTQRIWYRKSVSGAPATPGTASSNWVVKADDGSNAWTKMHIAISSTEKYIYTCEQYEMADGTVGYTSVLLDNTITVIDGGNIITNSIEAEKIKANSLTLGQISTTAQADILNSKVVVGGRNLLLRTASGFTWDINTTSYGTHHLYSTGSSDTAYDGPKLGELGLKAGDEVTLSFDWATKQYGSNAIRYGTFWTEFYGVKADGTNGYTAKFGPTITMSASNASGHYSQKMALTSLTINTLRMVMRSDNSCLTFAISNVKLEKGNKESSWTPAPEDQTEYVDSSAKSLQNGFSETIGKVTDRVDEVSGAANEAKDDASKAQSTADQALSAAGALGVKTSWLRFDEADGTGLHIGKTNSQFQTVIDEDSMDFMYGDQLLAQASGVDGFSADLMTTKTLSLGDYSISVSNGVFAIDYIGS